MFYMLYNIYCKEVKCILKKRMHGTSQIKMLNKK